MKDEFFWSVVIEEGAIQAGIWTIKDEAASVIATSNSASWEDEETLVTAADTCLSNCVQSLPESAAEPSKTVFGVPSSWVVDGQIVREHLDKVRLLCNKLSLTPTGFVVLPEAIAHFKKAEEKTQISAVVIGIYPQSLDISVFRFGNLAGTVKVARSLELIDDVVEGLVRFGVLDSLPSRVFLYDSKMADLEEARQIMVKADWTSLNEKIKFLHTPKIEIIEPEAKMAAVSLAGASEMGKGNVISFEAHKDKEEEKDQHDNLEGVVDASTLGFSVGEDVQEEKVHMPTLPKVKLPVKLPKLAIGLGFLKKRDMKFVHENLAFLIACLVLVGIVASFLGWWFLPKAQITVIIAPKKIEGKERIVFDAKASDVDVSKKIVPAQSTDTTVNADKTKSTTGTKVIGTASKGSVTFYNVGSSTTIAKGTRIAGSGLQFAIDNDVQIASASGAALPATAQANVTALGLGADYNLASGTFFSVGNFSSTTLQAKNDSAFSGGSSQEVAAVSKEDADTLTKDLVKQLTESGKEDLKNNLGADKLLVDSTVIATASAKNFDHPVGEEAATVKLAMTAKVTGLTIARSDMNEMAKQLYGNQVPNGFVLNDDQIDFVFDTKETQFMINLLPKIDTVKLAQQIAGKTEKDAKAMLAKLPGYTDIEMKVTPNIPFLKYLPHVARNIDISLSAK